jgi:hypothetical protein
MTSTERYRKDPEYRRRMIDRSRKNHERNLESPTYRRLLKTRYQLYNFRESIRVYREKIEALQKRIFNVNLLKEKLELQFGQERAARKRENAA